MCKRKATGEVIQMYRSPPATGMPFVDISFYAPMPNAMMQRGSQAERTFINAVKR